MFIKSITEIFSLKVFIDPYLPKSRSSDLLPVKSS